jgi:hypothetical protein
VEKPRCCALSPVWNNRTAAASGFKAREVSCEPVANRHLGIVFQSYALFPNINIINNIQYGLRQMTAPARRERGSGNAGVGWLERPGRKIPGTALWRPAAAGRPGPCAGSESVASASRRAALGAWTRGYAPGCAVKSAVSRKSLVLPPSW